MQQQLKSFATLLSSGILLACSGANQQADNSNEIVVKIGQAGPLSGSLANIGKDIDNGARMAVDEINAKNELSLNGKKVKLVLQSEDDAADPKQGVTVAQKLVDAKVAAVIGHVNSSVSIPASEIYSKAGIAQISTASTNPDYIKKSAKTPQGHISAFRVVATDDKQGPALVAYLKDAGAKSIFVLDDASQFGKGIADQVAKDAQAAGIQVLGHEAATDKTVDFKAILTKIKALNPEFIFWGGFGDAAAPLIQQSKELGLNAKLIAPDGTCTETFIKLAHNSAEGTVCSQAGVPAQKLAKGADFSKLYETKYPGQHVEIYAPYAYDAVYAIVNAIKKANSTDSEAIAAALPQINFDGYIGPVAFTPEGELKNAAVSILQVKNGAFEVIKIIQ